VVWSGHAVSAANTAASTARANPLVGCCITKALAGLKTVVVNRITVGQANISYNPEIITLQTITQTIRKAGYEARTPVRTE
jgi:hypothetical protein